MKTARRVAIGVVAGWLLYEVTREVLARALRSEIPPILRSEVASADDTGIVGAFIVTPGVADALGRVGERWVLWKTPTLIGRKR